MFALSVKISDWLLEDIDAQSLAVSNYRTDNSGGVSTLATDDYLNSSGYPDSYSKSSYSDSAYSDTASKNDPTWTTTKTTTTITVKVTDAGDYSYFSYSIRDADNNILEGPTNYATSKTYTFRGLDPNTSYRVYISWSTSTSGEGNYDYKIVTTDSLSVDYWDWTTSNGSATAAQTKSAYSAITNRTATSGFSYHVWNDMVDKVVDVWHAQGGYFNTKYLSYDETLMYSSDKVLTADRFNSLRYNIGLNVSTGIAECYPGDVVKGSYFVTLANCLNDWIDSL